MATGSLDGPWGFTFSGKLILATPLPWNGFQNCGTGCFYQNGEKSYPIAGVPSASKFLVGGKIWGYREIDLQATKDFVINENDQTKFYIRFDVLNVFNWKNYADYTPNATGTQVVYDKNGNITGVPREARFTAGFKF